MNVFLDGILIEEGRRSSRSGAAVMKSGVGSGRSRWWSGWGRGGGEVILGGRGEGVMEAGEEGERRDCGGREGRGSGCCGRGRGAGGEDKRFIAGEVY